MAKFNLELDKRVQLKNGRYNLSVRMCNKNDVMYLKITPLTIDQYNKVFVKKALDKKSTEFRYDCNQFLTRCETIFEGMQPFDKQEFRVKVYGKKPEVEVNKDGLLLTTLVVRYLGSNHMIKLHTKDQYKTAIRKFESLKPGISILDITPPLLLEFEKRLLDENKSPFTISSYMRHLRSVINHFMNSDRLVIPDYRYPFGKNGGYIIKKGINQKLVMTNAEINMVVGLQIFESEEEEYARDIWVLSYWCNGMNYADLLRLKRSNIHDDLIMFSRMKTENTLRNHAKDVIVPIFPEIKALIEKLEVKSSPYILGHLSKGYNENTFRSQKDWQLQKIRRGLKSLNDKLKLSVPLKYKTARDCYASTLQRAGFSDDIIDEMMGHAPVHLMAAHYKGFINKEMLFERNKCLVGINYPKKKTVNRKLA